LGQDRIVEKEPRILGFLAGEYISEKYPEIKNLINTLNRVCLPIAPGYAKFAGHTPIWNAAMDLAGRSIDWESQPHIDPNTPRLAEWKGDLSKTMPDGLRVLVEIELGNSASAFRDLAKFELGRKMESFDFFLLGVPGPSAKKLIQYATSFDEIIKKKELYRLFISTPCIIFEIEPECKLDVTKQTNNPPEFFKGRWGPVESEKFLKNYDLSKVMQIE